MLPDAPVHLLESHLHSAADEYQKDVHKVPHEGHRQRGPLDEGYPPGGEVHDQEELLALSLKIVLPKVRIQLALHDGQVIVVQRAAHIGGVLAESGHQHADSPEAKATGVATSIAAIVLWFQEYLLALRRSTDDVWPAAGKQQEDPKTKDADHAETKRSWKGKDC